MMIPKFTGTLWGQATSATINFSFFNFSFEMVHPNIHTTDTYTAVVMAIAEIVPMGMDRPGVANTALLFEPVSVLACE